MTEIINLLSDKRKKKEQEKSSNFKNFLFETK